MLNNQEVLALATEAHKGQYRDNNDPYITHPMRVASRAVALAKLNNFDLDVTYQVAILHDVLEDTKETPTSLVALGVDPRVVDILYFLNKHNYESYARMIYAIGSLSAPFITVVVKHSDLTDNLSDRTNPPEYYLTKSWKQRKDKYELSKMYLEQVSQRYIVFKE